MRVKRLELFGFKSFAEKTTIHFEPGVTAIVGPNGSGKSNIVDAIRWVLGEHNPRDVRAPRLEDVIFNGTDHRAPLSMGEVHLTIGNEQGLLPIAFTEVTVTRRVFRSGESEYSINDSPCRLKDIQELFLGTGLGGDSYAIIEQGHIDMVLSSKPQERRVVFEEASGVAKYLAKRQETLRRLEEVEEHLVRLVDIISEVRRQLSALERQANKARQYQTRWEQLKSLELRLAADSLRQEAMREQEREQQAHTLDDECEALDVQKQQHVLSLETCNADVSAKQETLQERRTRVMEITSQMEQHESQLVLKTSWIEELTRQVSHLEGEDVQLRSRLMHVEEQMERLEQQETEQTLQGASLQVQARNVDEQLKAYEAQSQEAITTIHAIKTKLDQAASHVSSQRSALAEHTLRLQGLQAQSERLEQQRAQRKVRREELRGHLKETLRERQSLQVQHDELRRRITSLQDLLDRAGNRRHECIAQLRSLRERLSSERAQVALLEDFRNRYEGFSETVKTLMSQPLEGLLGPLVDLIHAAQGYEEVVEASLGPLAEALVVQDRQALLRCRSFLNERALAGARFLVLSDCPAISPSIEQPALEMIGSSLTGSVRQFVQTDPAYQKLVDWLLNDAWVIDDLKQLLQEPSLPEARLVSTSGERWDRRSWRLIGFKHSLGVAGSERKTPSSIAAGGWLIHRERLSQAQEAIKHLEGECTQVEAKTELAEGEWQSILSQQESAKGELAHLTPNLHRLDNRVQQLTHEEQRLEEEERLQSLESEEVTVQVEENRSAIGTTQQALVAAEVNQHELEQTSAKSQQFREETAQRQQRFVLEKTQMATILSAMVEKDDALKIRRGELTSDKNTILEQLTSKASGRQESLVRSQALTEQLQSHRELLAQLETERATLRDQVKQSLAVLREAESKRDQIVPQLLEVEQKLSTLKQQFQELQQHKSETLIRREGMIQRLRELYQIDEATLSQEQQQSLALTEEERASFSQEAQSLRSKLEGLGPISLGSVEEYDDLTRRLRFLETQEKDLIHARDDLKTSIAQINKTARQKFRETFAKITVEFKYYYTKLFSGGEANLLLNDEEDVLESGIEIVARPPGKRLQSISLLSGGERALTAIALLFALFKVRPSPFCILDEIDAPLDEANVDRFTRVLEDFLTLSQFILITHNKKTITKADSLYGVTMEEAGVSKILSAKLTQSRATTFVSPQHVGAAS